MLSERTSKNNDNICIYNKKFNACQKQLLNLNV